MIKLIKEYPPFKKDELNSELLRYVPEPYRKNIYPFNSDLYLDYLDVSSFTDDNFIFNGFCHLRRILRLCYCCIQ